MGQGISENITITGTVSVVPAASSQRLTLSTATGDITSGYPAQTIFVTNNSDKLVHIKLGDDTVTATTSDFPVLAGDRVPVFKGAHTHVAVIGSEAPATSRKTYFSTAATS